jgi:hypothetical protein
MLIDTAAPTWFRLVKREPAPNAASKRCMSRAGAQRAMKIEGEGFEASITRPGARLSVGRCPVSWPCCPSRRCTLPIDGHGLPGHLEDVQGGISWQPGSWAKSSKVSPKYLRRSSLSPPNMV